METVGSYEVRSPFLCDIFPCHWVVGDVEKMGTSTALPKVLLKPGKFLSHYMALHCRRYLHNLPGEPQNLILKQTSRNTWKINPVG